MGAAKAGCFDQGVVFKDSSRGFHGFRGSSKYCCEGLISYWGLFFF